MRKAFVVAAAVAAFAVAPAQAQEVSVCTLEADVEITPGVSLTPHTGTFRTPQPGTITCTGALEGSGSLAFEGHTGTLAGGENCAFDIQGGGTLGFNIGNRLVGGTFEFSRTGVVGFFVATTDAGSMLGIFQFAAAEGQDCVNTPITRAHVTGQTTVYA